MEPLSSFTPRAQQVLALAREEAKRLNHNFVGTEHLLLGLVRLGQGTACNVLARLGVNLENLREEVEKQVGAGPENPTGNIPYTPRVKKVLALASKEAKALNHTCIGTEHILLGLLREGDGVAARVLKNLNVDVEQTRQEILRELDPNIHLQAAEDVAKRYALPQAPSPPPDLVDTSKRFDVYCLEGNQTVVYRNALFKGIKRLMLRSQSDILSAFLELEQADGQIVFLARSSIIKFCDPGVAPKADPASGRQST
jgi:ATP-dependent Clp protease ATP-binding subunit ClpA